MDLLLAAWWGGGWWWLWVAVVVFLLLIPLGYGWGYRGYGPPRFPYERGRSAAAGRGAAPADAEGATTAERAAAERPEAVEAEDPWGPLGLFVWTILLIVVVWFFVAWIWA